MSIETAKWQSELLLEQRKVESDSPLLDELSREAYVEVRGGGMRHLLSESENVRLSLELHCPK